MLRNQDNHRAWERLAVAQSCSTNLGQSSRQLDVRLDWRGAGNLNVLTHDLCSGRRQTADDGILAVHHKNRIVSRQQEIRIKPELPILRNLRVQHLVRLAVAKPDKCLRSQAQSPNHSNGSTDGRRCPSSIRIKIQIGSDIDDGRTHRGYRDAGPTGFRFSFRCRLSSTAYSMNSQVLRRSLESAFWRTFNDGSPGRASQAP